MDTPEQKKSTLPHSNHILGSTSFEISSGEAMKTNKRPKYFWFVTLLAVMIVGASLLVYTQASQGRYNNYEAPLIVDIEITPSATRPPHCVPLIKDTVEEYSPTATPERGKGKRVPVSATATPIPSQNVYDLSPELNEQEKAFIAIYRCDGSYEAYWLGPEISLEAAIQLQEGDIILQVIQPARLVGAKPTKEPKDPYPYPPPIMPTSPLPAYP